MSKIKKIKLPNNTTVDIGSDASNIDITDNKEHFEGQNVESALGEIGDTLDGVNTLLGGGDVIVPPESSWKSNEIVIGEVTDATPDTDLVITPLSTEVEIPTMQDIEEFKDLLNERYPFGISDIQITPIMENVNITFTKDGDNDWYISQVLTTNTPFINGNRSIRQRYILKINDNSYVLIQDLRACDTDSPNGGWHDFRFIGDCSIMGYQAREPEDEIGYCLGHRFHYDTNVNLYSHNSDPVVMSLYKIDAEIKTIPWDLLPVRLPQLRAGTRSGLMNEYGVKINDAGNISVNLGVLCTTDGEAAFQSGVLNTASGNYSYAEGTGNNAGGAYSHAQGRSTTAMGASSHAEGQKTSITQQAPMGHTEGNFTISNGRVQHVQGQYNIQDNSDIDTTYGANARKYLHIVGNGTSEENRSNAHTLDWEGNSWYAGNITAAGGSLILGTTELSEEQLQKIVNGEAGLTEEQVSALIRQELGAIENGTY